MGASFVEEAEVSSWSSEDTSTENSDFLGPEVTLGSPEVPVVEFLHSDSHPCGLHSLHSIQAGQVEQIGLASP